MLNHFDLYDLTAVLINIRDDIKSNSNLIILESLIKVLNEMRFVKGIFTQVAVILLFVQLQQTARFLCGSCK